ncbi:transcription termination factor NusA [Candidatus Woesebacteria bacterium RBG_16_36_11]|uniref:Transcription termination/antitermination protein NusA n=3 Tax=Candidatus Woeseibacteriota TaxID=1752722 RepID=A0A1F7XBH4_9BACT|nr:MAG: transcription termination factor NusA [Candidatus Woesebacteria bacterium RBG_13_36_22]OGM12313.1 MAG: transcription termination factor NusA [Candidatus Woesebacteria bacterium RBG_16_36_11]OGM16270.1 MAG: transcription termination factor NusA [Candidatus Woesebacteria bacterium RBG_19FT_COMBO_37_29]
MQTPRTEFAQALKAIATERGLDPDVIIDTIKQAIIAAYKRDARDQGEEVDTLDFDVEMDPVNGEAKVFAWPLEKPEERKDVTPPGFGRIAAQTAKQVIHQKIREAEKSTVMDEFSQRVGSLVSGIILRFDGANVRVDLGRTEAIMPVEERSPNERLTPNQRLTFLIKQIREGARGKEVILSRADAEFVKKLFAREVPEIGSGSVEIKSIAREAGVRTKMTVFSNQQGVDPVGSCVGQKGIRVQAVTNELGGERVDIIPWSENLADLVKSSLSPAENLTVALDEEAKTAHIKAPEDQLSLAIGRDGQNVRLSAKLTGYRIEIESSGEISVVKEEPKEDEEKPKTKKTKEKKVKEVKTKSKKVVEKKEDAEKPPEAVETEKEGEISKKVVNNDTQS